MFRPLSEFIPKAVRHLGLERQTTAAQVCEVFRKIAPEVIHLQALDHIYPKYYRSGILTIGVANSAWAQAVTDKKTALLAALNTRLNANVVKNLRTRVSIKERLFSN